MYNIDPAAKPHGDRLYSDTFDTRIKAAIRYKDFKLLTGNPGNVQTVVYLINLVTWIK